MLIIFVGLITLALVCVLKSSVFRFSGTRNRKLPLPPGTLGWPYIGETFQLYSQNPNVFFASKQKKLVIFFCLSMCFWLFLDDN